jgi:hypothetical protein
VAYKFTSWEFKNHFFTIEPILWNWWFWNFMVSNKLWSTTRWRIMVSDMHWYSTLVWHSYDTCRNSQINVRKVKQVSQKKWFFFASTFFELVFDTHTTRTCEMIYSNKCFKKNLYLVQHSYKFFWLNLKHV